MKRLTKRLALATACVAVLAGSAMQVAAWGSTGHRLIGVAAMRALPDTLPAFLRDPGNIADVGELSREPDRWKGAGQPHDRERDTAHFVDLDDNGHVMNAAGMSIDALPELKSEYDAALLAAGSVPTATEPSIRVPEADRIDSPSPCATAMSPIVRVACPLGVDLVRGAVWRKPVMPGAGVRPYRSNTEAT